METFLTWLIVSSKDPETLSLTVKGVLMGILPVLTIALGFANIQVGDLTPFVDAIIAFLQAVLATIAAVMTLYGLIRKVVLTLTGQHAGLNAM